MTLAVEMIGSIPMRVKGFAIGGDLEDLEDKGDKN